MARYKRLGYNTLKYSRTISCEVTKEDISIHGKINTMTHNCPSLLQFYNPEDDLIRSKHVVIL